MNGIEDMAVQVYTESTMHGVDTMHFDRANKREGKEKRSSYIYNANMKDGERTRHVYTLEGGGYTRASGVYSCMCTSAEGMGGGEVCIRFRGTDGRVSSLCFHHKKGHCPKRGKRNTKGMCVLPWSIGLYYFTRNR